MRTVIDIPDNLVEELDSLALRRGVSRAEAIRGALTDLVKKERRVLADACFGMFKDQPDVFGDGAAFVRQARADWRD
jgi:metal-responsive CopG/Arc/MetJ family transcriptional regulator